MRKNTIIKIVVLIELIAVFTLTVEPVFASSFDLRNQWYLESIGLKGGKVIEQKKQVVVAVVDDGVYIGHPDIQNNIWLNQDEIEGNYKDDDNNGFVDDRWGWDFVLNSHDMTVAGTHGTMVSGIIANVNPQVKIMPVIVNDYSGNTDMNTISKAIHYSVDNGADIINLSLGGFLYHYRADFVEAITYAYNKNVLVVASAGNGDQESGIGRNLDIVKISPVCNDGEDNMVIGVGSYGKNLSRTSWSNYGSYVDVYAPGEDIKSLSVPAYNESRLFYTTESGTSFSAPIVSGVASLIKAKFPSISNTALRNRIINFSVLDNDIKRIDALKAINFQLKESEIFNKKNVNIVKTIKNETNEKEIFYQKIVEKEKLRLSKIDKSLSNRLSGNIVLQIDDKGEAWYIFPHNQKRYFLGRPEDAFRVMKKLGLGVTHDFITSHSIFPERVSGKILIDVSRNGEAYYINPKDKRAYYLGRPKDSLNIMKNLGLGITNTNIRKIDIGELK